MYLLLQRFLLTVSILEIPLQIDKYLFYQASHGDIGSVGGVNVSVSLFAVLALYALWFIEIATNPHLERPRLIWGRPLLFYMTAVAVSGVAAEEPTLTFFEITLFIQAYLLFFYLANRLKTRSDLVFILTVIALTLIVESIIVIGTTGMEGPQEISLVLTHLAVDAIGRPCGTFAAAVLVGSFLAFLVVPAGCLAFVPCSKSVKTVSIVAMAIGTFAVMLAQSRGAIITVFFAGLVFGVCLFHRGWLPKWTPAVTLLVVAIAAFPMARVIQSRVIEGDEGSAETRIHLSQIAWKVIAENPVVGVGAGNCHVAMEPYAASSPFRSEWFHTVHCKYLLVWVETGLLGLVTFLTFLFSIIVRAWRVWLWGDRFYSTVALALVAAILGQMVHMWVDIFNTRQMVQMLWCFAGIIVALSSIREQALLEQQPEEQSECEFVFVSAA